VRRGWEAWAIGGLLGVAAIWQLAFALTWPLNHASGDAPNYLRMMLLGESNLTHAALYPYLLAHWLPLFAADVPADLPFIDEWFVGRVLFAQHALHFALSVAAMLLVRRAFGTLVALGFFALHLLSPFMLGNVTTTQPEWLQADLLVLSLALAFVAAQEVRVPRKVALHVVACALMGAAYLVKYNTLPFAVALVLVLVADRGAWRARLLAGALGAAAAVVMVQAWIGLFHAPTTGARDLHYNHAWILLGRLELLHGDDTLERSPGGIDVQRWRALVRLVPQEYQHARAFRSVHDTAGEAEATPHREAFRRVMEASPDELSRIIAERPLPPHFKLGVSMIPLMWYVGLHEADALGIAVFRDWVAHNPREYAGSVARRLLGYRALREGRMWVPTTHDQFGLARGEWLVLGYRRWENPSPSGYHERYWSVRAAVWEPGFRFFSLAARSWHAWLPERGLLALALAWMLLPARFGGGSFAQRAAVFALFASVAAFLLASNLVLFARDKETVALWPVLSLLWAVGAVGTLRAGTILFAGLRARAA